MRVILVISTWGQLLRQMWGIDAIGRNVQIGSGRIVKNQWRGSLNGRIGRIPQAGI